MKKCNGLFYGINDLRITIKKNKLYFLIAAASVAVGIAAAIKGLSDYIEKKEVLSFIGYIAAGEYPFGKVFFSSFILPLLLCFSIILTSVNYYSIFLYYLELFIASYAIFRNTLAALYAGVLFGLCSLTLFVVPLFLFNVLLITAFWTEVYCAVGYPCRKKILYMIPYGCHWEKTKRSLFKTITIVLVGNTVFTTFASLIFYLVFHS